jgi:hypothetical protein
LPETTNFSTETLERVDETATAPWMLEGHVHVHAVVPFWTKMTVNSIPLERLEIVGTTLDDAVVQEYWRTFPLVRSSAGDVEKATEFTASWSVPVLEPSPPHTVMTVVEVQRAPKLEVVPPN